MAEAPLMLGLEVAFDLLTAAVGAVAVVLLLRADPLLSLSKRARTLRLAGVVVAVILVASQAAEVWAAFSRVSTPEDALGEGSDLFVLCAVAFALYLRGREEERELSDLSRAAHLDHLTALSNRASFHRAAQRRMGLYEGASLPLACVLLDVDDFKSYNDRHGHARGDEALRCVARALLGATRADDLVARYGGDEFVALVGGGIEDAVGVAERTRRAVEVGCVPELEASLPRPVTVSAGVAPLTEETGTLERLVEAADGALYRAKEGGKNRVSTGEER